MRWRYRAVLAARPQDHEARRWTHLPVDTNIRILVTASDGELVGIVTSSDIIRALIGEYVPPSSD